MDDLLKTLIGLGAGGSSIYAWLLGFLAILGSAFGLYAKGRADRDRKQKLKDAAADLAAHERMNNAETGDGMSDDERRKWLSQFGGK